MTGRWRLVRALAVLAVAGGLSACGSISEKLAGPMSQMPAAGEPEETPARPSERAAFPAVHDIPPPRATTVLTAIEVKKMEDDLVSARHQQQQSAGTERPEPKPPARKRAEKPPRKQPGPPAQPQPRIMPTASTGPIY